MKHVETFTATITLSIRATSREKAYRAIQRYLDGSRLDAVTGPRIHVSSANPICNGGPDCQKHVNIAVPHDPNS